MEKGGWMVKSVPQKSRLHMPYSPLSKEGKDYGREGEWIECKTFAAEDIASSQSLLTDKMVGRWCTARRWRWRSVKWMDGKMIANESFSL